MNPTEAGIVLVSAYLRLQSQARRTNPQEGKETKQLRWRCQHQQALALTNLQTVNIHLCFIPQCRTPWSPQHHDHHSTATKMRAWRGFKTCPKSHRSKWYTQGEVPSWLPLKLLNSSITPRASVPHVYLSFKTDFIKHPQHSRPVLNPADTAVKKKRYTQSLMVFSALARTTIKQATPIKWDPCHCRRG